MAKLKIVAPFRIWLSQGVYEDGEHKGKDKPSVRRDFAEGQIVEDATESQAEDWKAKGLAVDADDEKPGRRFRGAPPASPEPAE